MKRKMYKVFAFQKKKLIVVVNFYYFFKKKSNVKIVWINTQTCQNLYNTLNMTLHKKKHEHETDTRITRYIIIILF